jgi:hypothetical protein
MKVWIATLQTAIERAQKTGQLDPSVDAAQLALEMNSLAMGAHWADQLLDKKNALAQTRVAILRKLGGLATKKCPPLPTVSVR